MVPVQLCGMMVCGFDYWFCYRELIMWCNLSTLAC